MQCPPGVRRMHGARVPTEPARVPCEKGRANALWRHPGIAKGCRFSRVIAVARMERSDIRGTNPRNSDMNSDPDFASLNPGYKAATSLSLIRLTLREIHDQAREQIEPRLDRRDQHVLRLDRVRAIALQPEALDHRRLGLERRKRRVGAAAFRDCVDHQLLADLAIDLLPVLG